MFHQKFVPCILVRDRLTDRKFIFFYFKEDEFEKQMERRKKLQQNSLADELREELLDKPKEIKVNNYIINS